LFPPPLSSFSSPWSRRHNGFFPCRSANQRYSSLALVLVDNLADVTVTFRAVFLLSIFLFFERDTLSSSDGARRRFSHPTRACFPLYSLLGLAYFPTVCRYDPLVFSKALPLFFSGNCSDYLEAPDPPFPSSVTKGWFRTAQYSFPVFPFFPVARWRPPTVFLPLPAGPGRSMMGPPSVENKVNPLVREIDLVFFRQFQGVLYCASPLRPP